MLIDFEQVVGDETQYFIEGEYNKAHFHSVNALIDHYVRTGILNQPYQ